MVALDPQALRCRVSQEMQGLTCLLSSGGRAGPCRQPEVPFGLWRQSPCGPSWGVLGLRILLRTSGNSSCLLDYPASLPPLRNQPGRSCAVANPQGQAAASLRPVYLALLPASAGLSLGLHLPSFLQGVFLKVMLCPSPLTPLMAPACLRAQIPKPQLSGGTLHVPLREVTAPAPKRGPALPSVPS